MSSPAGDSDIEMSMTLRAISKLDPHELLFFLDLGWSCKGKGFLTLAGAATLARKDIANIEMCADILISLKDESVNSVHHQGLTPLMIACRQGSVCLVNWLINHGAKLDSQDYNGWTALMYSVERNWNQIAELLEEKGASTILKNDDGLKADEIAGGLMKADIVSEIFFDKYGFLKKINNMEELLHRLNVSELIPTFRYHSIGVEKFLDLFHEEDFVSLGITKAGIINRLIVGQIAIQQVYIGILKTDVVEGLLIDRDRWLPKKLNMEKLLVSLKLGELIPAFKYHRIGIEKFLALDFEKDFVLHGKSLYYKGRFCITKSETINRLWVGQAAIHQVYSKTGLRIQDWVDSEDIGRSSSSTLPWMFVATGAICCLGVALLKKIL